MTPATVTVAVDPNTFANQKGTVGGHDHGSLRQRRQHSAHACGCSSTPRTRTSAAPSSISPASWWTFCPTPARNRYYVLRQDKNQVLVFDGTSNQQIAMLRTGNTPTSMAMTFDNQLSA